MVGTWLHEGLISPSELVDVLLVSRLISHIDGTCLSPENTVGVVYRKFIERLSELYLDYMTTLDYIPGSFTAQQAGEILSIPSVAYAKQFALKPIRKRSMLMYDSSCQRFDIQGILREVLRANYTIKDLPAVRTRYCQIFSAVMKELALKMGTAEYTTALAQLAYEQPNLCKLLGEVNNSGVENYHFFIEMASSCTDLIEIYLASESESFYEGCLKLADQYGQDMDKAAVFIAVGSMETHTKGDLLSGARKYESALSVLEQKGRSLQLAKLYQKLGWNVFKQGDCPKAIQLYNKSLEITKTVVSEEYEPVTVQSLSYLGVAHVVLGHFDAGERFHTSCLQRSERVQGSIHPKVGDAWNRIGLLYEQRGDMHKALEFFTKGLQIKKQSDAAPISVVYSLSNVANGHKALGDYKTAHSLVDEAFQILSTQKIPMLDGLSLMFNTRGKIYAVQGKWKEACEAFRETVEITKQIEQKSYIYMKRLLNLAEMEEKRQHYATALKLGKEALELKEVTTRTLPHNFIVTECLQCIARIYQIKGDIQNYTETLYMIQKECIRLGNVCVETGNEIDQQKVTDVMTDLRQQFCCLNLSSPFIS